MDLITGIVLLFVSVILGFSVRRRFIPPISMEYFTAGMKAKESLRSDKNEISFISNVFFGIGAFSLFMVLMAAFPGVKLFRVISYISLAILFSFVVFKSVKSEIEKKA